MLSHLEDRKLNCAGGAACFNFFGKDSHYTLYQSLEIFIVAFGEKDAALHSVVAEASATGDFFRVKGLTIRQMLLKLCE